MSVPSSHTVVPVEPQRFPRKHLALLCLVLALGTLPFLGMRLRNSLAVGAQLDQGAQFVAQGRPQEAEQAWLEAKRLAPDDPTVYQGLGALYRAQGRIAEASAALNRLADLTPNEPHLLCEFAENELRIVGNEGLDRAVRDAVRAATLEPNCVRALTVAGNAWLDKGDQKQGIDYLRRAVRQKPEDVSLTLHLINKMLETNDAAGAHEVILSLIRRYPGYGQGYVLLATVYALVPQLRPAGATVEATLRKGLQLDPTNGFAHSKLGYIYLTAGDNRRAISHLEAALLLRYRKSSLLFNLSQAYRNAGRTAEADRVNRSFQTLSRLENEGAAFEKQRVMDPQNPTLRQRLAEVNAALEQAQALYDLALPSAPKAVPALPAGMNGGSGE